MPALNRSKADADAPQTPKKEFPFSSAIDYVPSPGSGAADNSPRQDRSAVTALGSRPPNIRFFSPMGLARHKRAKPIGEKRYGLCGALPRTAAFGLVSGHCHAALPELRNAWISLSLRSVRPSLPCCSTLSSCAVRASRIRNPTVAAVQCSSGQPC